MLNDPPMSANAIITELELGRAWHGMANKGLKLPKNAHVIGTDTWSRLLGGLNLRKAALGSCFLF